MCASLRTTYLALSFWVFFFLFLGKFRCFRFIVRIEINKHSINFFFIFMFLFLSTQKLRCIHAQDSTGRTVSNFHFQIRDFCMTIHDWSAKQLYPKTQLKFYYRWTHWINHTAFCTPTTFANCVDADIEYSNL